MPRRITLEVHFEAHPDTWRYRLLDAYGAVLGVGYSRNAADAAEKGRALAEIGWPGAEVEERPHGH